MLNLNIKSRFKNYILALFFCFILFFLEFINIFSLSFYHRLIFSWKKSNYQLLQKALKPAYKFTYLWNLTSRLEDLQYRYAELSAELSSLKNLEKENQDLRKILENSDRKLEKTTIVAPIISFSQPVLALGLADGLSEGSAVFFEGSLLGFLKDLSENQSRVELLNQMTDKGVLAVTEAGIKGLVKGDGKNILLTEVPSEDKLELNQMVSTIGQEGVEKGLYIGRIRNIRSENLARSTQVAEIEQLINFYELSLLELK